MVIDKRGRLFGKISIIDIIIVLVIAAAAIGVYYKFMKTDTVTPFTKTAKVQITFYSEDTSSFSANAVKVGDIVKDRVNNVYLGKVVNVKVGPDIVFYPDVDGKVISSSKPGYNSVMFTVEVGGVYSSTGVTISGNDYYINKTSFEVRVGITNMYMKITNIAKVG